MADRSLSGGIQDGGSRNVGRSVRFDGLTMRGRAAVLAVILIGAFGLLSCLAVTALAGTSRGSSGQAGDTSSPPSLHEVIVRRGDTLWSVATRIAPDADPRAEVDALIRANRLADPTILPGQTLRVP